MSLPQVLAYTYVGYARNFSEVGINAHRFSLPLGWTGPDVFDPTAADSLLSEWASLAPDSTWYPMLWIDGPDTKWWEAVYPEECAVMRCRLTGEIVESAEGVPQPLALAGRNHGGDSLFDRNHQRSPCLHSFASEIWLRQAGDALQRALRYFHARYPNRFQGFYICAGLSHEWFGWGNYSDQVLFDYSKPMANWFRSALRLRYGTLDKINTTWATEYKDWESVEPPLPRERCSRDDRAFRMAPQDQAAVDFDCAQADAQARCLIRLCELGKEVSSAKFGGFYGYWWTHSRGPSPARNGHLAYQKVLDSPAVDFLASPLDYVNRGADGSSASQSVPDSAVHHRKGFINSADIRLQSGAHPDWQPYVDAPNSVAEGVEWMKKDFGFSMAHGLSHSWVDLFGGAFEKAEYRAALGSLQRVAAKHRARWLPANSEALLVLDESSLATITPGHAAWTTLLSANRQWHLSRCGFPWNCVTMEDFLTLDWPSTKLVNFLVCNANSQCLVDRIRSKLAHLGATAIWNHFPGMTQQLEIAEQLTGLSLALRTSSPTDWEATVQDSGLLFGPSQIRDQARPRMRYFPEAQELQNIPCLAIQSSSGACTLANWRDDGDPCVIETQAPGFRSILSTGLLLHESLLAKIASEAGVHLFTSIGPTVHANARFASVWTRGENSVFACPEGVVARSLWPGDSESSQSHFFLQKNSSTLLALDSITDVSPSRTQEAAAA